MNSTKRIISLILVLIMCLGVLPAAAMAEDDAQLPISESPASDEVTAKDLTEEVSLTVLDGDLDSPSFADDGELKEYEGSLSPMTEGTDEALALSEPVEVDSFADLGGEEPEPLDGEIDINDIEEFAQEIEIEEDIGDIETLGGIAGAKITLYNHEAFVNMDSGFSITMRVENVPKGGKLKLAVMKDLLHTSDIVGVKLSAINNGTCSMTISPKKVGKAYIYIFLCNSFGIPYDYDRFDVTVCNARLGWAGYVDEVTVPVGGVQTLYFYGDGYSGPTSIGAKNDNPNAYGVTVQAKTFADRVPIRIEGKKVGSGQIQVTLYAKGIKNSNTSYMLSNKTVKVNVVAPEKPKVKLSSSFVRVSPGKTVDISVSSSGYNGTSYYISTSTNTKDYTCKWISANTIRVTGVSEGSGKVSVALVNLSFNILATNEFTVQSAPIPVITAPQSGITLQSGNTSSATYKITNLPSGSSISVYNPRSDLCTATFSSLGGSQYKLTVAGKNAGSLMLTINVKDRSGAVVASSNMAVTVKPAPPSIKVSATTLSMGYNQSKSFNISYYNCTEATKLSISASNGNVTWTYGKWSGNTMPITVKGLSAGDTALTVRLNRKSDGKELDTATVTVKVTASAHNVYSLGQVGYSFGNYITTISEKICQYVYGNTQVASNVYSYAKRVGLANGVCYGMATSGGLLATGTVSPGTFSSGKTQTSQLSKNDYSGYLGLRVSEFIEAIHVAQISTLRYDSHTITNEADNVARGIMSEIDAGRPVFVGIRGADEDGKDAGHRVTAFGYVLTGNTLSVSIYDPNSYSAAKTMTFTRPGISSPFNTWSFSMGSLGTWGSGRQHAKIYYSTLSNIRSMWNNMGKLSPVTLTDTVFDNDENLIITDEPNFTLYTMDFDTMSQIVVAKVVDGRLVQAAEGVYNAWDNETGDENRFYMFTVPEDYYFVNDDSPENGLCISIVDETVSTTIETDKCFSGDEALGMMGFCAEDSTSTAEASVTMVQGASYAVSIGSTDPDGVSKTISKEGVGIGSPVTLGLRGDTVSLGSTVGEGDDPYDGAGITIDPDAGRFEIDVQSGDGGSVTPSGISRLRMGENLTVRIVPDKGWSIAAVYVDGEDVGPVGLWSFEDVTDHHTLQAAFKHDLSVCDVTLEQTGFTYDGEAKTPAVTVKDENGQELTELVDYIVCYDDNVEPGTAEATVVALCGGIFTGAKSVSFIIEGGMVESAEADGERITVRLTDEASSSPGILYAAAYDPAGRLLYVVGKEAKATIEFKLDKALPEGSTVKLFLVDDNSKPMMPPYNVG